MINSESVYINVGIMDDEPKARQRATRIIENWSLDLQKPGHDNSQTTPLLWEWLKLKILKEKKLLDKNAKISDPDVIHVKARIIITAQTPSEFESKIDERTKFRDIDVIVSDVVIPDDEYNGLEFAKRWNNKQDAPIFVMVSAHDLAIKAFDIDVADYILKPLRTNTLSLGLCKALTKKASKDSMNKHFQHDLLNLYEKGKDFVITVTSSGGKYNSLLIDDIIMFKSETKCTIVVTSSKEYFSEYSLKKINSMYKLSFLKIRRNFLVSVNHIVGFTNVSKREEMNKDVKGRTWFVRVKRNEGFEDIEIARREWGNIYRLCDISPNIDCKKDIVLMDDKMRSLVKYNLSNQPDIEDDGDDE